MWLGDRLLGGQVMGLLRLSTLCEGGVPVLPKFRGRSGSHNRTTHRFIPVKALVTPGQETPCSATTSTEPLRAAQSSICCSALGECQGEASAFSRLHETGNRGTRLDGHCEFHRKSSLGVDGWPRFVDDTSRRFATSENGVANSCGEVALPAGRIGAGAAGFQILLDR